MDCLMVSISTTKKEYTGNINCLLQRENIRKEHMVCFLLKWVFGYITFFFFCLLGPHPWHMEAPRLGAELELQLLAYATATAAGDPSHIYNLYHSSRQRRIFNTERGQGSNLSHGC